MRTTIRPLTILFSLFILSAFGAIPYLAFFKDFSDGEGIVIFMTFLFLLSLAAISWFLLVIRINLKTRMITFIYPLRFQKLTFDFDDILGFRYQYLRGKINYRSIQFKVKEGKTFSISDFETSNLREIEKLCLDTFELRSRNNFTELNKWEKESQITASREFDIEQAKEIRILLLFIFGLTLFTGFLLIKSSFESNSLSNNMAFGIIILIFICISIIMKFIRQNRIIKNSA